MVRLTGMLTCGDRPPGEGVRELVVRSRMGDYAYTQVDWGLGKRSDARS
jgi:hypothetical protein